MNNIIAILPTNQSNDLSLQLSPIELNETYRKDWNIHEHDFVCLTKDGELISESLYRVGGFGYDLKGDYFMLIKHIEAFFDDRITKIEADKPHLEGRWCIINKNGIEKVEFKPYKHPYLHGGLIYSVDNNYYNIETKEFYCNSNSCISSIDYLFIDNKYDKDLTKRGVMMINKKDGTYKIFN